MITIFALLGLGFLGGGVWALVDGWPYLVLERGFTQVIIGSVGATAGVILLGLARVMAELRQLKTSLSHAATAFAVTSLGQGESGRVNWPSTRPAARILPEPVAPDAGGFAPATIGLASAGAALAAASALGNASRTTEAPPAAAVDPTQPKAGDAEHPGTRWLAPELSAALNEQSFAPFPPATGPAEDFREPRVQPGRHDDASARWPELAAEPIAAETLPVLEEPPAGESLPEPEPESIVAARGEAGAQPLAESSIWWPEINASADLAEADPPPAPGEPASLRERLNIGPALPDLGIDSPIAPPATPTADAGRPGGRLDAAEAWMNPVFSRREPFFGEPSAQPVAGEALWPSSPLALEPAQTAQFPRDDEPPSVNPPDEPLPTNPAEPEEQPGAAVIADTAPAASEEGVIGAYQVGEAHFTLFADGSIKAKTPDGDYDFRSMDELKVYLASEKSRLGV